VLVGACGDRCHCGLRASLTFGPRSFTPPRGIPTSRTRIPRTGASKLKRGPIYVSTATRHPGYAVSQGKRKRSSASYWVWKKSTEIV
jgi:hypothetical protein